MDPKKNWPKKTRERVAHILAQLHLYARRYCDGRSSVAAPAFNDLTKELLDLGFTLYADPIADGGPSIWARDVMGREFDKLTESQAQGGTPEAQGAAYDMAHGWRMDDKMAELLGVKREDFVGAIKRIEDLIETEIRYERGL